MPTPMERYMRGWQLGAQLFGQRQQREMQERQLGLRERGLRETERYHTALMEKMREPEEPRIPYEATGLTPQEEMEYKARLRTEKTRGGEATAYARDLALKEQNRLDYMKLRTRFGGQKMVDETGMFLGSPQDRRDYNKFKMLEAQFGEKPQVPKPKITTKELLNKTQTISAAGTPIDLTPELKFMRLSPFENLDETTRAEVDKAYEALGMPTSETRNRILEDLRKGSWGDATTAVENLMNVLGYDEKTANWLVKMSGVRQ